MSLTVKQHQRLCSKQYLSILETALEGNDPKLQEMIRTASANLLQLWAHCQTAGVMSSNEDFSELSTQAMALFVVPFYIGNLASKRILGASFDPAKRCEVLTISNDFLQKFLQQCVDVGLITLGEVDHGTRFQSSAAARTQRIELFRQQKQLSEELQEMDSNLAFIKRRNRRTRNIIRDDAVEENGDDETAEGRAAALLHRDRGDEDDASDDEGDEEQLRARHAKMIRWCVGECYTMIQLSHRELEMFGAMSDDDRKAAVAEDQKALEEEPLRRSNLIQTVIPGPMGADPLNYQVGSSVGGPPMQQPQGGANYSIMSCGHAAPLRQQIVEEAFQNRNMPTQTLAEYADEEMAAMAAQAERDAQGKLEMAEEMERLGEDGMEEGERKKQARWDDWRDEHPPLGISNKGNYT
jgi:hypothetical protein